MIATAAYGSEMAAPVQFLRNFRDKEIMSVGVGREFMSAFNNWYYSWAPSVARSMSGSDATRGAVRAFITPLIGALYLGHLVFELSSPLNPELAVLLMSLVSGLLVGAIYLTPVAYTILRISRRRATGRTLLVVAAAGVFLALFGTLSNGSLALVEILGAVLVLEPVLLAPTLLARRLAAVRFRVSG